MLSSECCLYIDVISNINVIYVLASTLEPLSWVIAHEF